MHPAFLRLRGLGGNVLTFRGLCVSVFITTVTHGRTAEPTKITFGVKTHVGPRDHVFGWGCSLVSPGEYDGSLAGAMAVHAVASITVATVQPAVNWSECNSSTLV